MTTVVLDAGNSLIKARINTQSGDRETSFPHALLDLTESEFERIMSKPVRPGPDYIRVNGQPFVVGESAERHGTLNVPEGAARYEREYYGVFVAAALARLYERGGDVTLFGSHPPGDSRYRDELIDAALGLYHVELDGRELNFRVTTANTFDEPLGGLMHVLLTRDGQRFARGDIREGTALVIDIGGKTTDFLAVESEGRPDHSLDVSENVGINGALDDFQQSLHDTYRELFKSGPARPAQYRNALATGIFDGAGRYLDCHNEAREATSILVNSIRRAYQRRAGGPVRWHSIVLTGGGAAMLYDRLVDEVLEHPRVFLAEDMSAAHLANVRGGAKLWKFYETEGIV